MAKSGKPANYPPSAEGGEDRKAGAQMTVLIVDDHELFRQGMTALVERLFPDTRVVGATTAAEALVVAEDPAGLDLVLLDLNLPDADGQEVLGRLVALVPDCPVAVVTASDRAQDMAAAYRAGAKGYIVKSSTSDIMRHALELIVAGETYIPTAAAAALWASEPRTGDSPMLDSGMALTPRQQEVLALMAQGLQNREISARLEMPEPTVKVHVKGVFQKLGVNNRTHAVITAIRLGLVSPDTDPPDDNRQ